MVLAADSSTKAEACSDATGRYEIPALPGDNYKIRVRAAGYAEQWPPYERPDFLNAQPSWLSGDLTAQVDVRLRAGSGTVRGRITNEDGSASQSTVTVERTDATRFDPAGTFTVKGIATQKVKVEYIASGPASCWYLNKTSFRTATPVAIRAGTAAPPVALVDCKG